MAGWDLKTSLLASKLQFDFIIHRGEKMAPEQIQIGPITLIPGRNDAKFPFCNSLYIEAAGLLFDPSSNRTVLEKLHSEKKIRTVCLSHWHEDHIRYFYLLEGCDYWISEADSIPLRSSQTFVDWYGLDKPGTGEIRKSIEAKLESEIHFKPRIPDRILTDGEFIDLGSVTMEVIGSPGHSPGHLSFFFPEPAVLFLGDYNLDLFGPWTGDPYADIDQCIESINRLRQVPAEVLITGHCTEPITANAEELWERYIKTISAREEKILGFLNQPRSLDDIIDQWIILERPKEPVAYFRLAEKAHIEKHLQRMIRQGAIRFVDTRYHLI